MRLSASEMMEAFGEPGEGITVEEGVRIAKRLEELGVDLISVSTGTYETGQTIIEPINTPRNWRDPIIRAVRDAVSIPVMGTSIIREPEQAETMLADGLVDLIAMGRSWLADPEWAKKAIDGRDEEIVCCIGCMACFQNLLAGGTIMCAVNPRCAHETEYPAVPERDLEGRRALVVGGGPAGCEAAIQLALRGADVLLAEADDHLGGQVHPGCNPPGKAAMRWVIDAYEERLRAAGVKVELGCRMDVARIREFEADEIVVATGALPVRPNLPGLESPSVVDAVAVLDREAEVGRRVVVVGSGMTGLETAELLASEGHEVVGVYEMAERIGAGAYPTNVMSVAAHLRAAGRAHTALQAVSSWSSGGEQLGGALGGHAHHRADVLQCEALTAKRSGRAPGLVRRACPRLRLDPPVLLSEFAVFDVVRRKDRIDPDLDLTLRNAREEGDRLAHLVRCVRQVPDLGYRSERGLFEHPPSRLSALRRHGESCAHLHHPFPPNSSAN